MPEAETKNAANTKLAGSARFIGGNRHRASQHAAPPYILTSWAHVPVLPRIMDLLTEPKDLAAAALTCKGWAQEASREHRWSSIWGKEVGDQGLWKWAKADGGYREQLRAKALINKGDAVASTFTFNRRDGFISEILMLDSGPEPRILTVQHKRLPQHSVRLQGATLKVWSAAALTSQRPLLVVHDVVKHLQLEDGRLFMWRIANDAFIRMRCIGDVTPEEESEARRWAQNPSIVASVLEPVSLNVVDIKLDSSYGRGTAPHEWMDMCAGAVAAGSVCSATQRISVRLLELEGGSCFRESSCRLPAVPGAMPLHPDAALVLLSRNSDAEHQVVAAAALFDCRVFRWRLRDAWLTPEARRNMAAESGAGIHASPQRAAERQAVGAADDAAGAGGEEHGHAELAIGAGIHGNAAPNGNDDLVAPDPAAAPTSGTPLGREYVLHHVFTTKDNEPIVDLSISTAARRMYVLGLENIFVLGEDGSLQLRCNMTSWRGARPAGFDLGAFDVGAFSWPLPHSHRAAIYLDSCNSLYVTDFQTTTLSQHWDMRVKLASADSGKYPQLDRAYGRAAAPAAVGANALDEDQHDDPLGATVAFTIQSHVDLRPSPRSSYPNTSTGRITRPSDNEQVIVEYNQAGNVLFTGGDASCPSTAALLRAEKVAGTYLPGLGPTAVTKSVAKGPLLSRQGAGDKTKTAISPRALICINPATGERFKAFPVDGAIESVHSCGHYLAVAVGPLEDNSYNPDGLSGSITILDFTQQGFGLTNEQRAAHARQPEQKQQQLLRRAAVGKGGRKGGSGNRERADLAGPSTSHGSKAKEPGGRHRGGGRTRCAKRDEDEPAIPPKKRRRLRGTDDE